VYVHTLVEIPEVIKPFGHILVLLKSRNGILIGTGEKLGFQNKRGYLKLLGY